jgi:hypothetical protein
MARHTIVVVALIIAAGIVAALLPAQESARRRSAVYGGAPPDADPAPSPEPGLLPVVPDAKQAQHSTPAAGGVPPAGIFGRGRRSESLQSQLHSAGEAASQDYTPTPASEPAENATPKPLPPRSIYQPAEISPPAQAVPMPSTTAPPTQLPQPIRQTAPPGEAPVVTPSEVRSVLKRTKTATPDEGARPPLVPTAPAPAQRSGPSSRRTSTSPAPSAATASRAAPTLPAIDTRSITELTISSRSPSLRVDLAGPQAVTVGKPAAYVVTLVNESEVAAQDVQLRLALPGFVTIAGSQPTSGQAAMQVDAAGQPRLVWSLPEIDARRHETLRLELVASEGNAFDLGVEWTCRPSAAKAAIVVKQAQLQLSLAGPADMIFGEEKSFTLSLANPGNGDAENVVLNLSSGENRRQQIDVGTLPAGQRKEIPVKIVASQPGEMAIHAVAAADGGLTADAAGKVIVRKAELGVIVEGPELTCAGADALFVITIQNTGDAPADNVQIAATLPPAARFLGGVEGAAATAGSLRWKVASLPPGSERSFEIRLQLNAAGENRIAVQAQGAAGLTASGDTITTVEAAAKLKLVVNDPAGPLPTSETAVYEIQVMNRGSQAARQIKIAVQFGEGIEPVAFEGAQARIVPGQVVCQPLDQLNPGEQVTMRVKAKADRGGSHQFRVEVNSSESETRLVTEGTTRFFAESGRVSGGTAKRPTLAPQGGTYRR